MKKILILLAFAGIASFASAQSDAPSTEEKPVVHEYVSVEFSPALRKMGVFSTSFPNKVVDMKPIHMDKSELDIITFFNEVQELERQGWQVSSQAIVALEKGHMYVWSLRKAKP
ncbi:MAG: hypothetical protein IPL52_01800 [Flavobacteriales bacterium]|nr:hypothetical protein [Flavobacteriales bacterium]